ncbi:MAG: hypothetical protein J6W50_02555 [Bacteroidaceae bacterium]|nr:hypothetical protein [Bacteroidaceae bacterium]MBP5731571.1 hypothetical protein [Bacteroidaceae bacterium]
MKRLYLFMLLVTVIMSASARLTFTQRLQMKSANRIHLRQDKDIDRLVDGREAEPVVATAPSVPASTNVAKTAQPKQAKPVVKGNISTLASSTTTPTQTKTSKPTAYTTRAGWRVKFFTGGSSRVDKENAQAAGREFKRLFPDTPVYMHFVSPHWICVAGDFVNKEDADAFISRVRESRQFNTTGMTVMKSRVKVPVE